MSYLKSHKRSRAGLAGLGDVTDILSAGGNALSDPCIGQVTALLTTMHDLEQEGGSSGPPTPGIGLCKAVMPLQLLVQVKQQPWLLPLGAVAIIGGLIGIGYALGSGPPRRTS